MGGVIKNKTGYPASGLAGLTGFYENQTRKFLKNGSSHRIAGGISGGPQQRVSITELVFSVNRINRRRFRNAGRLKKIYLYARRLGGFFLYDLKQVPAERILRRTLEIRVSENRKA